MGKAQILLILGVAAVVLNSCSALVSSNRQFSTSSRAEECIPASTTFAYPLNTNHPTESLGQILPLPPWEIVDILPTLGILDFQSSDYITASRTHNSINEIWIIRNLWSTTDTLSSRVMTQIWIYQPEMQKWSEVPTAISDVDAVVFAVHIGDDGIVWAEGATEHPILLGNRTIAVYNQDENRFDYVEQLGDTDHSVILFDPKNLFWIVKDREGIYSFDPVAREYELRLAIPDLIVNGNPSRVALAPDGSLYIASVNMGLAEPKSTLLHYDPDTGQFGQINVPITALNALFGVFVTNSGDVWLDDIGWMEPNGIWYQTIRSPIFISAIADEGFQYAWPTARLTYESSDGRLWFDSYKGEAWLDPQVGEWCLFTTVSTDIVEDADQVLWLVAGGKLFSNELP